MYPQTKGSSLLMRLPFLVLGVMPWCCSLLVLGPLSSSSSPFTNAAVISPPPPPQPQTPPPPPTTTTTTPTGISSPDATGGVNPAPTNYQKAPQPQPPQPQQAGVVVNKPLPLLASDPGSLAASATPQKTSSSSSSSQDEEAAIAVIITTTSTIPTTTTILASLPISAASVVQTNRVNDNKTDNNNDDDDKDDDGVEEEDDSDDDPIFTMETMVTIMVTLVTVLTNCTTIIVAAWTEAFNNFNKVFIYSMTLADLLTGLFIMPYSIFLSVFRKWVFSTGTFCNIEAYLCLTLQWAKLFSLTWLNVDHYIAVRKPERYSVMMSKTRSFCWITISWMAAICFFMPPMLSYRSSFFNKSVFLCQADTKEQIAYILTSVVLVSVPSLLALFITNIYIFTKAYKKRISFYEKVFVELSTRPWNYHVTVLMCAAQISVWIPFSILSFVAEFVDEVIDSRAYFYLCWLGLCCSFTNFPVLFAKCSAFRQAVWEMYSVYDWCPLWCCCTRRHRHRYANPNVNVISLSASSTTSRKR